jgi:hypothetical protein
MIIYLINRHLCESFKASLMFLIQSVNNHLLTGLLLIVNLTLLDAWVSFCISDFHF